MLLRKNKYLKPSPTLFVGKVTSGLGVFTNSFYKQGDKILDFAGPILARQELPEKIIKPEDDRYLQIGEDLFLGPSGSFDDLINHSCCPNCGVLIKGQEVFLIALRDIEANEELTYDYSIQMHNDDWTMPCLCGSPGCRQIIREYKYLPKELKDFYLQQGFVPDYNLEN